MEVETEDGSGGGALLQLDPEQRPTARKALAQGARAPVARSGLRVGRARGHWAAVRAEVRRRAFYAPTGVYARLMGAALAQDEEDTASAP